MVTVAYNAYCAISMEGDDDTCDGKTAGSRSWEVEATVNSLVGTLFHVIITRMGTDLIFLSRLGSTICFTNFGSHNPIVLYWNRGIRNRVIRGPYCTIITTRCPSTHICSDCCRQHQRAVRSLLSVAQVSSQFLYKLSVSWNHNINWNPWIVNITYWKSLGNHSSNQMHFIQFGNHKYTRNSYKTEMNYSIFFIFHLIHYIFFGNIQFSEIIYSISQMTLTSISQPLGQYVRNIADHNIKALLLLKTNE